MIHSNSPAAAAILSARARSVLRQHACVTDGRLPVSEIRQRTRCGYVAAVRVRLWFELELEWSRLLHRGAEHFDQAELAELAGVVRLARRLRTVRGCT